MDNYWRTHKEIKPGFDAFLTIGRITDQLRKQGATEFRVTTLEYYHVVVVEGWRVKPPHYQGYPEPRIEDLIDSPPTISR